MSRVGCVTVLSGITPATWSGFKGCAEQGGQDTPESPGFPGRFMLPSPTALDFGHSGGHRARRAFEGLIW